MSRGNEALSDVISRPIRVGLTGGVGSGKSLFARFLEESGAEIIDVDALARQAMEADRSLLKNLQAAFGSDILNAGRRSEPFLVGRTGICDPSIDRDPEPSGLAGDAKRP